MFSCPCVQAGIGRAKRNEDRSPQTRSQESCESIRTAAAHPPKMKCFGYVRKFKKILQSRKRHRKSLLISAQTINRSGRWEGFMLHLLVWWNVSQRFGWAELHSQILGGGVILRMLISIPAYTCLMDSNNVGKTASERIKDSHKS